MKKRWITYILMFALICNISMSATGLIIENKSTFSDFGDDYDFIVDDDGTADFNKIQDAINSAFSGDTIFVKNGFYKENLVVEKSIILIGENKIDTIVDGGIKTTFLKKESTVIQVNANNVKISGFTFKNATGIDGRGIYILKERGKGYTSNNNISDNIIRDCSYGMIIVNPVRNIIINNSFYNCTGGFYITTLPYYENTYEKNTVNGKPLLYIIGKENLTIDDNVGCIALLDCKNITIQNLTTSNITVGIDISFSDNITVTNCTITGTNRGGIYVHYSNNCKFIKNTFIDDNWGIFLRKSNNNQMLNNNFVNITKHDWFSSAYINKWDGNYWKKPLSHPKLIYGKIGGFRGMIPWFNIDWNPSEESN